MEKIYLDLVDNFPATNKTKINITKVINFLRYDNRADLLGTHDNNYYYDVSHFIHRILGDKNLTFSNRWRIYLRTDYETIIKSTNESDWRLSQLNSLLPERGFCKNEIADILQLVFIENIFNVYREVK